MQDLHLKKYMPLIILAAVFLACIPFSIYGAAYQSGQAQSPAWYASGETADYTFAKGTTVSMLQKELDAQPSGLTVAVFTADGSEKAEGELEDGDIVQTLDEDENILSTVTAVIKQEEESSSSAGDDSPSSGKSGQDEPSSSAGEDTGLPEDGTYYILNAGTCVDDISENIYEKSGRGDFEIKIKARGGRWKQSGLLCTGDTLEIISGDGENVCEADIVVLGDLTGCGDITAKSCDLMYSYLSFDKDLTGCSLAAADMDRDGEVDTSDLLLMKRALWENSQQSS